MRALPYSQHLGLVEGELVDDRSLEGFDGDSFRHEDFVRELAGVICRTHTPASIALFGAWGSGKSGIANLMRLVLPKNKTEVRFVVFDASKYAEAPLRRHFISQVAHGLDIDDEKYHQGLYIGEEGRRIRFNARDGGRLVGAFLLTVLLTLAILLAIATAVAALSVGPFKANWSSVVRDYLLATLPVAAVVTLFVKLAADGFHVRTTRSAPSGDEEFEARFQQLVEDAKTRRVVVFIDELDRCSPEQVASTLETLKTFLFVRGCVFVVAADQQVLEQALRRKVRQHTPEDAANPYYSAGSSYLDKVFQYQMSLPPLRSPALSRYALSLVNTRPGVWERIPALDEVVSVLVPTHVVSPRRVKVLLNRYALMYRLAERRAAEGRLDPDFGRRAPELAKLVCLQSEFPLFAEDLTLDARLPELVRMVADREPLPPNLRPEVAQRATEYAHGTREVAELLIDGRERLVEVRQDGVGDEENDDGDPPEGQSDERGNRADDVVRRHAQQLLAYLRKTRYVAGPGPDLFYLESAGAGHGIDAVLADRLQRAAVDNDTEEVLALVASAAGEGEGRGALLVLADVVRQAQPGVEGRNVVAGLLQGIQRSGVDLGSDADYIADAVASHSVEAGLNPADFLGALVLARASSREVGNRLTAAVLGDARSWQRPDVAVALLAQADRVPSGLETGLSHASTAALLKAPAEAADALLVLPSEISQKVLMSARTLIERACAAHYAAVTASGEEGAEVDEAALLSPPPHEALAHAYDAVSGSGAPAQMLRIALLALMLQLDQMEMRTVVPDRLRQVAPIRDAALAEEVLSAAHRRKVPDLPAWLDALDAGAVGRDQALQEWLDSLAGNVWGKLGGDDPPAPEDLRSALEALQRCAIHATIHGDLRRAIQKGFDEPFTTDAEVAAQGDRIEHASAFVCAGLLEDEALADIDLGAAVQTLRYDLEAVPAEQRTTVIDAVRTRIRATAPRASEDVLRETAEAVTESQWLPAELRASTQLMVATARRRSDASVGSPVSAGDIRELATGSAADADLDEAVALWIGGFAETPEVTWTTIEPLVSAQLPPRTREALSRFAQGLDGRDRFELIDQALERTVSTPVHSSYFEAARLSEVPAKRVAERLIQLFEGAHGEGGWRAILNLWQQLAPTSDLAQRRLVEAVYIPLIGHGDEGFDLAIAYFGLVASISGIRRSVTDALEQAATTDEQRRRVETRLLEAGWKRRKLLGLGPPTDQREPE